MVRLLVSVRTVTEALAAAAGGADVIDLKEPSRGSLGRPAAALVASVLPLIPSQFQVSVALGDLEDPFTPLSLPGVHFVKIGLAGWGERGDWQRQLREAGATQKEANPTAALVAAAYADWRLANAPAPNKILAFALDHGWQGLLIDTALKNGSSLGDHLPFPELERLVHDGNRGGLLIALAGALRPRDVPRLAVLKPDYIGVRGAACRRGRRDGPLEARRVRILGQLLRGADIPAAAAEFAR